MWMATGRSGFDTLVVKPASCHSHTIPKSLSKNAGLLVSFTNCQISPDHICRQFETAYQLALQSRHTPGLNIHSSPYSNLTPAALTIFCQSLVLYCWRRPQCLAEKLSSIPYLLSADLMRWTSCLGKQCSVSPIIFIIICLSRFSLLHYII